MQSAVLAVAFSLSAMGWPYGAARGGWYRHACYRGGYYGGYPLMAGFAGGYPQGWSSPAYAPMSYRGGGYSAPYRQVAGYAPYRQVAGYSPMSSGYSTAITSYPPYSSTTPMSYGAPSTATSGTTTYSSSYGIPAAGMYRNPAPGQMAPGSTFPGATGSQAGMINQGLSNTLNRAGTMASPNLPGGTSPRASVPAPPAAPGPNP